MAIAAVYSPPGDNNLKENLEAIFQKAPNFIIGGDINSKSPAWEYKQYNKNGKMLEKLQDDNQFSVAAPNESTYYPYNTNQTSWINKQAIRDMEVKQELSSDHEPIIAMVTLPNSRQPYHKLLLQTDWEKYEKSITSEYPEFQNHEITELNIESKIITGTIKHHMKKASTTNHSTPDSGNKNQEIESRIKERNKTSRHYQQSRTQQLKNKLDEFNREISRKAEAH
ncbi:hypothetical protein PR048_011418 [Dryococelus australis]|uniref:Endonuclease/exonuclease/phosphatase domain-containing protein n=1 Tax=Dryococelus australis TaxID=614101 RepID=A0ABQ9HLM1_9NEOP|nr:hypothetical protein PR048_011418 [Dryococelus australis]